MCYGGVMRIREREDIARVLARAVIDKFTGQDRISAMVHGTRAAGCQS